MMETKILVSFLDESVCNSILYLFLTLIDKEE